jgi:excisionase family DNA binding protein
MAMGRLHVKAGSLILLPDGINWSLRRVMAHQGHKGAYDTMREFAEEFRISPSSVHRAIEKGHIKAIKVGGSIRIPRSERERIAAGDQK